MKWISENKFLAAFLAVVIVGSIVLLVLLSQSHSSYSAISAQYDEKARELARLQGLQPYPNAENLKNTQSRRDQYRASMNQLLAKMSSLTVPLRGDVTPNSFQDELRASVSAVTTKAAAASLQPLPEGFYLGFEPYQNTLPSPSAAGPLERQLKAIEAIVGKIIDGKIIKINSVVRPAPLPEEATAQAAASTDNKEENKAASLVERSSVLVSFTCQGGSLRQILNDLVQAKQYFIVRSILVKNEELEGPARSVEEFLGESSDPNAIPATPSVAGAPVPTASPGAGSAAAGQPKEGKQIQLLVGDEKLDVEMLIEILNFKAPATEKQAAAN